MFQSFLNALAFAKRSAPRLWLCPNASSEFKPNFYLHAYGAFWDLFESGIPCKNPGQVPLSFFMSHKFQSHLPSREHYHYQVIIPYSNIFCNNFTYRDFKLNSSLNFLQAKFGKCLRSSTYRQDQKTYSTLQTVSDDLKHHDCLICGWLIATRWFY